MQLASQSILQSGGTIGQNLKAFTQTIDCSIGSDSVGSNALISFWQRWVQQEFCACCMPRKFADDACIQHIVKRDFGGIAARENCGNFGSGPRPQLFGSSGADFLQKIAQQPSTHAPGQAEAAMEGERAHIQSAIDIDLFVYA